MVFSFSSEELAEAEDLNARVQTRMTDEYVEFLRRQLGEGEECPVEEGNKTEIISRGSFCFGNEAEGEPCCQDDKADRDCSADD